MLRLVLPLTSGALADVRSAGARVRMLLPLLMLIFAECLNRGQHDVAWYLVRYQRLSI